MAREATFKLLIGTNNTGKSHVLKKFLRLNRRNLICFPNDKDSTWKDYPLIDVDALLKKASKGEIDDFDYFFNSSKKEIVEMQRTFKILLSNEFKKITGTVKIRVKHTRIFKIIADENFGFFNGGLFLDDFKSCIPNNNLPSYIRNLLDSRRHFMLDIFAATHSPKDIPPDFLSFNPDVYLFRTTGNFESSRHKYLKFEKLLAAQTFINNFTNPSRPGYKETDRFKFVKI